MALVRLSSHPVFGRLATDEDRIAVALSVCDDDERNEFDSRLAQMALRGAEIRWLSDGRYDLAEWAVAINKSNLTHVSVLEIERDLFVNNVDNVTALSAVATLDAEESSSPTVQAALAAARDAVVEFARLLPKPPQQLRKQKAIKNSNERAVVASAAVAAVQSMVETRAKRVAAPWVATAKQALQTMSTWLAAIVDAERACAIDLIRGEVTRFKAGELAAGTAPPPVNDDLVLGGGGGPAVWADDVESTMARLVSGYLVREPKYVYGVVCEDGMNLFQDPEYDNKYGNGPALSNVFARLPGAEDALLDVAYAYSSYSNVDTNGLIEGHLVGA